MPVQLLASMLLALSQGSAAPAPPAASAPAPAPGSPSPSVPATTGTLVGKAPVAKPKPVPPPKEHYGSKVTTHIDAPEPPVSAIYMPGSFPPADAKKTTPARMIQKGLQFKPALLVIQAGSSVVFPNEDDIYHNVFSLSPVRKFDVGKYRKGEEPEPVTFEKPGLVSLFCEVHEHMRGSILVVDTPHFTVTAPDGSFRLGNLPVGSHVFRIWISPKETIERSAEIRPGQETSVDWTVPAAAAAPAP